MKKRNATLFSLFISICNGYQKRPIYHNTLTRSALFSTSAKKIVFLGTPDVAASSLGLLYEASRKESSLYEIVGVVTQPPAPAGRNKKLTPSPVSIIANSLAMPVLTPESAKDPEFLENLKNLSPDLCITAAYGNFLPKKFLEIPKFGTVNIHPSLLPKYRGAAPVQRCLENGDKENGVTVLFTVLKMDAGPIIKQVVHPLNGNEKAPDHLLEMFLLGTKALLDSLPSIFDGTIICLEQNEQDVTHAPKLTSADACISFFDLNAAVVHNKCRGYAGWPGIWSNFLIGSNSTEPQRLKIITTHVLEEKSDTIPFVDRDQKVSIFKHGGIEMLRIVCGDGSVLGISEIQPPAKKVMSVRAFYNGLRDTSISWVVPENIQSTI